jgi:hypothetical protein
MLLTPTTELDAVNTMLTTIGESPVSSLEVSGLTDVAIAKSVLREISRVVQSKGWHFNSEKDYPLSPTVDGYLIPPSNTIRIDTTKYHLDRDVIMRGSKMYDKDTRTYVFTDTLEFDLIVFLDFEELPEAARHYITIRASRVFQRRVLGSEAVEAFTQDEEAHALAAMMEAEGDTGDANMLNGSYSVAYILER